MIMRIGMAEADALETGLSSAELIKLQAWFSPSFPIGSFSYSHGLEWAVKAGDVRSAGPLHDWI